MDMEEIRNIVIETAQLPMNAQQISDNMDLDDAGITSLGRMNVILALEDRLQINFPDDMMTRKNFSSITAMSRTVDTVLSKACGVVSTYIPLDWLGFFTTLPAVA